MRHQAVEGECEDEDAEEQHRRAARQVDEQRDPERGADDDHRRQAHPFIAQRLPGVLEADAKRTGQIRQDEQSQRELERHQVRGERNGHQRRAEAGDAEDQRAKERDPGEQRYLWNSR